MKMGKMMFRLINSIWINPWIEIHGKSREISRELLRLVMHFGVRKSTFVLVTCFGGSCWWQLLGIYSHHNPNVTNITDREAYSNIIFRDQLWTDNQMEIQHWNRIIWYKNDQLPINFRSTPGWKFLQFLVNVTRLLLHCTSTFSLILPSLEYKIIQKEFIVFPFIFFISTQIKNLWEIS